MMWWAMWCGAVVVASGVVAAPSADSLSTFDLQQIDPLTPDDDSFAVSQMGNRYASAPWMYFLAEAPRDKQSGKKDGRGKRRMPTLSIDLPMALLREKLNLQKEMKLNAFKAAANRDYLEEIGKRGPDFGEGLSRPKRKMPSLSINNPMEVLRQRLLLEVARKQMREANQRQAFANRLFLQNVGKRGFWTHSDPRYDN